MFASRGDHHSLVRVGPGGLGGLEDAGGCARVKCRDAQCKSEMQGCRGRELLRVFKDLLKMQSI